MELTLDFRARKRQTPDQVASKLEHLTRSFSDHAHTRDAARARRDLDTDPVLTHFSPDLVFRSNNKEIYGRDAYVEIHRAILLEKPQMVFRLWDVRVHLAGGGKAAEAWMTADLFGFDGGQRLECTFVYYWKLSKKVWVCDRIGGLTSMGGFSHALY